MPAYSLAAVLIINPNSGTDPHGKFVERLAHRHVVEHQWAFRFTFDFCVRLSL